MLVHVRQWHPLTVAVGVLTIAAIWGLRRTRVGSLGLVLAVALGSLLAFALNTARAGSVNVLDHIVAVPNGLPAPVLPDVGVIGYLLLPALALSLVGLVQGAGVSAATRRRTANRPTRLATSWVRAWATCSRECFAVCRSAGRWGPPHWPWRLVPEPGWRSSSPGP